MNLKEQGEVHGGIWREERVERNHIIIFWSQKIKQLLKKEPMDKRWKSLRKLKDVLEWLSSQIRSQGGDEQPYTLEKKD